MDELLVEGALFVVLSIGIVLSVVLVLPMTGVRGIRGETRAFYQERAEAGLNERDALVQAALHDISIPLTATQLRIELLTARLGREEALERGWLIEQVTSIRSSVRRLTAMINDLPAITVRQEGHPIPLRQDDLEVTALVRDAATMALTASAGAGRPQVSIEAPSPCYVLGDRVLLERALCNLIGRALTGSHLAMMVDIKVGGDGTEVVIEVRARAKALGQDDKVRVGARFRHGLFMHRPSGTELGFFEAKAIVKRHGGYVSLPTAAGQGPYVTIRLPERAAPTVKI